MTESCRSDVYLSGVKYPAKNGDTETYTLNEQIIRVFQNLQAFRNKSEFTDVMLCVGEEQLPCHKVVLAASSNYFHAMFSSPYKEQVTSQVFLEHVSPWAVHRLLDFSYLGVLELSVSTVQDIFVASSLLDYPVALKHCVRFMEQHLELVNCLGVEALAEHHGIASLSKAARKLAVENFSSLLLESSEWVLLSLPSVLSYIRSDELDVSSEEVVWNACLVWISHDSESRLVHLPVLLSNIRLCQLSPQFLANQLRENDMLKDNLIAYDMLKAFLDSSEIPSSLTDHWSKSPRPATRKRPTMVVLGGLNNYILNCMQSFSPVKTAWLPCPQMPLDNLAWFAVAVVSNVLYVIGGIKAGTMMSSVYSYSPVTNRWSKCCSMPHARARHAAVAVGGSHILIFGGLTVSQTPNETTNPNLCDHNRVLDSLTTANADAQIPSVTVADIVLRYDVCCDSWVIAGRSQQPRIESRVLILGDAINPQKSPEIPEVSVSQGDSAGSQSIVPLGSANRIRQRQHSSHKHVERTLVEIGGYIESQPHGTDQVSLYSLRSDLTVVQTGNYIKLPHRKRYVNCALQQTTNLIYLFWEESSELSVLDIFRNTLRSLAPLSDASANRCRVHAGLTWVGNHLYVVGGFSEFVGDDRRPITPRNDVHQYDPDTNTWSLVKVTNTTVPRAIFGCVCLNM